MELSKFQMEQRNVPNAKSFPKLTFLLLYLCKYYVRTSQLDPLSRLSIQSRNQELDLLVPRIQLHFE